MRRIGYALGHAVLAAGILTSCSGSNSPGASVDNSGARGSLAQNPPPRLASLTAADFTAQLKTTPSGTQLVALATLGGGALRCGVDVYYLAYGTVGGAGEKTTATGALMVPTGPANQGCSGARPIVLYAHGSETDKGYNLANLQNAADTESPEIAALYASNGFIVVAPNFAGYDKSPLPYHPYLNADQQSKEMIDVLAAARTALAGGKLFTPGTTDNGKLFVTGYSEGGHVAMATQRALEAANIPVTASSPGSGPYAIAAMVDAILLGNPNFGVFGLAPLITSSYHFSYANDATVGDIYNITGSAADIYEADWASTADSIAPAFYPVENYALAGTYPLAIFDGTVPPAAADLAAGVAADGLTGAQAAFVQATLAGMWPSITPAAGNPVAAFGFATGNLPNGKVAHLWKNSYRAAVLADALLNPDGMVSATGPTTGMPAATPIHPARKAFKKNDLRGYFPVSPTQLCGGLQDPEVFYQINTQGMMGIWSQVPGLVGAGPTHIVQPDHNLDPGISITGIGTTAGGTFVADVMGGKTSPAVFAADVAAAVGTSLTPSATNFPSALADPLQGAFLQGIGQAVATLVDANAVSGIITKVTGANPPFTSAVLGANAGAIATAIGTASSTAVIEAYHGNIVEPLCRASALYFFLGF
jgi:hypothetical protein